MPCRLSHHVGTLLTLATSWRKAREFCGSVETAGGANQEFETRRLGRGEENAFPVHTGGRTVWQMDASAKSGGNFYCMLSLLKRGSACQKTFREGRPRRTSVAAGEQQKTVIIGDMAPKTALPMAKRLRFHAKFPAFSPGNASRNSSFTAFLTSRRTGSISPAGRCGSNFQLEP